MYRVGIRPWSTLIAGLTSGLLLLGAACKRPPLATPQSISDSQLLRVVLRFDFDDAADEAGERVELLDVAKKLGTPPDPAATEAEILSRHDELRGSGLVPVRYRVLDIGGDQIGASGYFLVDRRVHHERLDPRTGTIADKVEGIRDRVTLRVPIPLYHKGHTFVLEELESVDQENIEESEFEVVLEVVGFLAMVATSESLADNLANPTVPFELVSGDGDPDNFNIVFLGDGFTRQPPSIGFYRQEVSAYAAELLGTHPLGALQQAINIYRVDVVSSTESGVEKPGVDTRDPAAQPGTTCTGVQRPETFRPNTLQTHFCGTVGSTEDFPFINATCAGENLIHAYAGFIPSYDDVIIVLVNDRDYGGAGFWSTGIAFASVTSSKGGAPADCAGFGPFQCVSGAQAAPSCAGDCFWEAPVLRSMVHALAVHELGHAAFELGDEYCVRNQNAAPWHCRPPNLAGCGPNCSYSGGEPSAPNVSRFAGASGNSNPTWLELAQQSGSSFPTHRVPGCAGAPPNQPLQPPPLASDLVGFFEGATHGGAKYQCGVFRPQHECKMNFDHSVPFCPVCRDAILAKLEASVGGEFFVILDTVTVENLPADLDPTQFSYQVLPDWTPPSGPIPPQPSPQLVQRLRAETEHPIRAGKRFQNEVVFRVESLVGTLAPTTTEPHPQVAVHLRVADQAASQEAVGSCVVPPSTGVHIVAGAGNPNIRCTVSVVNGTG